MVDHIDVVISSTTKDLNAHRQAVHEAIIEAGMFPHAMEDGAAKSKDPLSFSLDLIDKAQVYVGIFGLRYGYVPTDPIRNPDNLSITELEYRHAVKKNLPICIFIISKYEIGADELDDDPAKLSKLKALKAELGSKYAVAFCDSVEKLHRKVYQTLTELVRDGVVKLDEKPAETHRGAVKLFPTPPTPYIAHPYTLAQDFFGRAAELHELDDWARSDDPVLIVEAIGGIGKSALTWEWVKGHAATAIPNLAGVVWWSFYDSDGTLPAMTRHALVYLTGQPLEQIDAMPAAQREAALLRVLAERPVLLVFDGFERTLAAYHQMEAPRLNDENVQTAHAARKCTDPKDGEFLAKLAACCPSKVLISTRLIPRDLEHPHNDKLRTGVRHRHLNGLAPDDALALMRHLGVTGNGKAIIDYTAKFDHHSLLINIFARKIVKHHEADGDFDVWLREEGTALTLSDLKADMAQNRTYILQYALSGLTREQSLLLCRIAAFRYPVDYAALKVLNPYAPPKPKALKPPETFMLDFYLDLQEKATTDKDRSEYQQEVDREEAEFAEAKAAYEANQHDIEAYQKSPALKAAPKALNAALDELQARGLLQRSGKAYDLHPVVRGYAFEQLTGDDRKTTFAQIRDHFDALPPENLDAVQEIHELRRTLEIYGALVGAGLLDAASDFYRRRLAAVLADQIAAYPLIVELLTPLFPDGLDSLPALTTPERQSAAVTYMANAFYQRYQTDRVLVLYELGIKIDLDLQDAPALGAALHNYASALVQDGQYAAAGRTCQLALSLGETADDADGVAMSHLRLLSQYANTGQWAMAEAEYRVFNADPPASPTEFWQTEAERYYTEMLVYRGLDASAALDRVWTLAAITHDALEQRVVLRLRGQFALEQNRPANAVPPLLEAIRMAQKSGVPIGGYRGDLARAYVRLGRQDEARALVAEGVSSLAAADVYLELGERDTARGKALEAYESAWADGEPYSSWYALKQVRALLAALGEPEPALPPFDPAKVKPIPYEAEIVAFIEELKAKKAGKDD